MNIQLDNAVEFVNGEEKGALGEVFIRYDKCEFKKQIREINS